MEVKKSSVQNLAMEFFNKKNESSFNPLYKRIKPGMVYYANNILKDMSAAEDVVSEAFAKIWKKIDQYNPYWNFSTWAYKIVYNESMQYLRKDKTLSLDQIGADKLQNEDVVMDYSTSIIAEEPNWYFDAPENPELMLYDMVLKEINQLPDLYKNIMIDREINKMKYQDISNKYGLEINTVKTRINRARSKICRITNMGTKNKKVKHEN